MPELSFETHFFQDLVETDIFYVALLPRKENVKFNAEWFSQTPNLLTEYLPESDKYTDVIKVHEIGHGQLQIMCDIISQKVVCLFT